MHVQWLAVTRTAAGRWPRAPGWLGSCYAGIRYISGLQLQPPPLLLLLLAPLPLLLTRPGAPW